MTTSEPASPALAFLEQRRTGAVRLFAFRDEKQPQVCRAIEDACRDDPGEPDDVGPFERDEEQVAFSQSFADARVRTMASYAIPTQQW